LTPSSILLGSHYEPLATDFGRSRGANPTNHHTPQLSRNDREYDFFTDVCDSGMLVSEAVTYRRIFLNVSLYESRNINMNVNTMVD
jgi:hypothetical protein